MKKFIKVDRSNVVIFLTYLVVFVATIVLSLFNVGLDLSKLMTSDYLGNLCLNYALSIIIVTAAMKDSETREIEKDYFKEATNNLLEILNIIKQRSLESVFKFYTKARFKKMREDFINDQIFKAGMPKDIYNLTLEQIKELRKENKINDDQYSLLKRLKHGKFKFREITSEEILNDYDKTLTYQDMRSNRNKIIVARIVPKFILLFATSAIFAAAVIDNSASGTAAILTALFTRIINIMTALFAGYIAGPELVEDRVKIKKLKKNFCREFLNDFDSGAYIPNEDEMTDDVLNKVREMASSTFKKEELKEEEAIEEEIIEFTEDEIEKLKEIQKQNEELTKAIKEKQEEEQ